MSSTSEGEGFKIGAHVDATDGHCGHLARVIFNPVADVLTHLVVQPGRHEEQARLVHVDLVAHVEKDRIRLSCTKKEFERLDEAEDIQFLPAADVVAEGYPGTEGYPEHAYAWPYYRLGGIGLPLGHHREGMFTDRVPVGEIEVRRGDAVHARDGWIGSVQGLVIDPADHHVTHVLLQEGHLWGRKQVAIPIGAANRADGEIRVDLTKDEIEALPPVSLQS